MATEKSKTKSTPEVVDAGAGTKPGEQIGGTPAKGVAAPEGGATPEATQPAKVPDTGGEGVSKPDTSGDAGNAQQVATAKDTGSQQPEPSVNQPNVSTEQFITRTREAPILPSK